ncbi:hypothetical protein FACS189425_01670 [Clostridia bacterium]|nr:hypothetical protein FACS189425_01670 [Clostridia bacterium]
MKSSLGRGLGALIPGADSNNIGDLSDILGDAIAVKKLEKKTFELENKIGNSNNTATEMPQNTLKTSNISSENDTNNSGNGIKMLKIRDVEPCHGQPRNAFDKDELEKLTKSISIHGIIQPIIVRSMDNGRYEIIAGERRWRAAQAAGLKEIPVVIRQVDNENIMELALIENLQRVDLNPIDEALGYKILMEKYNSTQEQISERIGKSRSAIANSLRLLNLPQPIKELVETGDITSGHARALATLTSENKQKEIAERIIRNDLSVRSTEKLVKSATKIPTKTAKTIIPTGEMAVYLEGVEKNIARQLGTKVKITQGSKKSTIQIEYYTNKDLDRIVKILTQE